jgi:DNA polymerase-3 subunit epsilon
MSERDLLAVLDLETTGVDVETDRIVTAFVGLVNKAGVIVDGRRWLVNPGVPIPAGATAVNGITDEMAQTNGVPPIVAVAEIIDAIAAVTSADVPLVVYNAAFDLTVLDRESRRHHGVPFPVEGFDVVDPLVIDKAVDRYRSGSRRLVDTAAVYGVPVREDAHDATADCIMAAGIAFALLARLDGRPRLEEALATVPLPEYLMVRQAAWRSEQSEGLQDYFRRTKDPHAVVDGSWPQVPFVEPTEPTA